jgi:3-hydroxymyristoyl/3-hydroxydecanoyl-(acyl carrier protein) dehydratase
VSAGLAHPMPADARCPELEMRVRAHEWVDDARLFGSWMLVVPSVSGARALRRHGKRHLTAAWQGHAGPRPTGEPLPLQWRLLEALPPPGSSAEARCVQPLRDPIISEIEFGAGCSLQCRVRVPYDLAIFDGHFPAIPIVPGAMQVGWVVGLARSHMQLGGDFSGIAATKFRRLVQPGMSLALTLDHQPCSRQLRFDYSFDHAVVSTGRVLFGSADD